MGSIKKIHLSSDHLLIALLSVTLLFAALHGFSAYSRVQTGKQLAAATIPYNQQRDSNAHILILGDSLAYGVGTTKPENSFAGLIGKKFPDANIVNKASIGNATADLANSLNNVFDRHYTATFIIIGGNDIVRPSVDLSESKRHIDAIYAYASKKSDYTVHITTSSFKNVSLVSGLGEGYFNDRAKTLRDHALTATDAYSSVSYVDFFDVPKNVYKTYEAEDGFHLNDAGVEQLVELLSLESVGT